MLADWRNKLYFGDNLQIMRNHVPDESVDLVYLDPPFNSKADYNVLFKTTSGKASAAQATAFKDTWEWDEAAAEAYHELMMSAVVPGQLKNLMESLKVFLTGDTGKKGNSMMAYLTMMALRLVELHRVLKPTGSLYLHCDPTASHYIKLVLDAIFGVRYFRNEISWTRSSAHNDTAQGLRRCGRIRDVIFFYTKSESYTWNPQYTPYDEKYIKDFYKHADSNGRRYRLSDLTAAKPGGDVSYEWRVKKQGQGNWVADLSDEYISPVPGTEYLGVPPYRGRYWAYSKENLVKFELEGRLQYASTGMPSYKRFLDEMPGVSLQDSWTDILPIQPGAPDRLGYPTQKPQKLLDRILEVSSNEHDVVLDPFCGCGTTVVSAEKLKRKWIGIDVTYLAVDLMERRLLDQFAGGKLVNRLADIPVQKRRHALKAYWARGEDELGLGLRSGLRPFEVVGTPTSVEDARFLFQNDPFQFEWWCVAMVGAQGRERKGADRGIDGIINFQDKVGQYKRALVSVKGGQNIKREMVATLKGDMAREGAVTGVLVCLENPTGPMKKEAADAGRWNSEFHADRSYPVIQILTVEQILNGESPDLPRWGLDSFRVAPKASTKAANISLDFDE